MSKERVDLLDCGPGMYCTVDVQPNLSPNLLCSLPTPGARSEISHWAPEIDPEPSYIHFPNSKFRHILNWANIAKLFSKLVELVDTLTGRDELLSLHYHPQTLKLANFHSFFQVDNCEETYLTVLFDISLIISEITSFSLALHISSSADCPFNDFIHYPIKMFAFHSDTQDLLNSRS